MKLQKHTRKTGKESNSNEAYDSNSDDEKQQNFEGEEEQILLLHGGSRCDEIRIMMYWF